MKTEIGRALVVASIFWLSFGVFFIPTATPAYYFLMGGFGIVGLVMLMLGKTKLI